MCVCERTDGIVCSCGAVEFPFSTTTVINIKLHHVLFINEKYKKQQQNSATGNRKNRKLPDTKSWNNNEHVSVCVCVCVMNVRTTTTTSSSSCNLYSVLPLVLLLLHFLSCSLLLLLLCFLVLLISGVCCEYGTSRIGYESGCRLTHSSSWTDHG